MTIEQLIKEAKYGKTSRDMDYRYKTLLSFGEDILADKISLTEKEILKYLDEYEHYLWDTEKYGGYDDVTAEKLYGTGMKIIKKYNLYRYIEIYYDIFYCYSYNCKDQKVKDEFEKLRHEYNNWVYSGAPEGKYVRWKNVKGR
ncbi:MAG: hypothetical protein IKT29_00130 [Flavobacteriales bacterium]|nr:hypothetical protein [Flavobacteriales bacterium]